MKNQRDLLTMAFSEIKESYVAPKTMSYSVQNEGMLCSSDPTVGGITSDPIWGDSAGFDSVSETNLGW